MEKNKLSGIMYVFVFFLCIGLVFGGYATYQGGFFNSHNITSFSDGSTQKTLNYTYSSNNSVQITIPSGAILESAEIKVAFNG